MTVIIGWTKIWDDPTPGYVVQHNGFQIIAHRTWRTSPAGWVWAVRAGDAESRRDPGSADQYGHGCSTSRQLAFEDAVGWLTSERGERALREVATTRGPVDYLGHTCVYDDGEHYGIDPHWWTLVEDHYSVSAPTLRELQDQVAAHYARDKAGVQ